MEKAERVCWVAANVVQALVELVLWSEYEMGEAEWRAGRVENLVGAPVDPPVLGPSLSPGLDNAYTSRVALIDYRPLF